VKTIEITTRTIGEWLEFDKKIAEKIIEKYRDINTDFNWYENTIAEFVKDMEMKGLDIDTKNVNFSGFWSQGDGASFTCNLSPEYIDTWIGANKAEFPSLYAHIGTDLLFGHMSKNSYATHYCHDKTVNLSLEFNDWNRDNYPNMQIEVNQLEQLIITVLRGYMVLLYNTLKKEYEYLASDESIIDTLKANEYEFDVAGRIRR